MAKHTQRIDREGETHIRVSCTCGWSTLVRGNMAFPRDLRKAQAEAGKHDRKKHG